MKTKAWQFHLNSFICTKIYIFKYLNGQYARRNYIKSAVIRLYFRLGSKLIGQFIVFRLVQVQLLILLGGNCA